MRNLACATAPPRAAARTTTYQAPRPNARSIDAQLRGTETILLAEDDDAVRDLLHAVLELSGYTVIAAASPVEALRKSAQFSGAIHALVTDFVMPELTGCELATRLRLERPDLRVLLMSGFPEEDEWSSRTLPGAAFIAKPFPRGELLAKIRTILA